MGRIHTLRNPELFQGRRKCRRYFEGWYFKLTGCDERAAAAAIPGIALGETRDSPESHAFVQFILNDKTFYFRYPLAAFRADSRAFGIAVGGNKFSLDGVTLCLENGEGRIAGELTFSEVLPFPKTALYPGIMGPFSYIPFMECYHGIVSVRHRVGGQLSVFGETLDFDGGTGYIEKDWGSAFPSRWAWVQANHFADGAAFLFSVAEIPWLGRSFTGFFSLLYAGGEFTRLATYTGARITRLAGRDGGLEGVIRDGRRSLEFYAKPGPTGMLKAPKNGLMDRVIEESLCAEVHVRLTDREGATLFEGTSGHGGMERYDVTGMMTC